MLNNPSDIHEVEALANKLLLKDWKPELAKHNFDFKDHQDLILAHRGWTFDYDKAKKRFGCCSYRKKQISLSLPLVQLNLNNPIQIIDTILHEIAHALEKEVFKTNGHGKSWKWLAKVAGCKPERCYSSSEVEPVKAHYIYQCPNCKREINRYKKTNNKVACGQCCKKYNGNKFSDKYIFTLKLNLKENVIR